MTAQTSNKKQHCGQTQKRICRRQKAKIGEARTKEKIRGYCAARSACFLRDNEMLGGVNTSNLCLRADGKKKSLQL